MAVGGWWDNTGGPGFDPYWRHHPTSAPSVTVPVCPRCGCVLSAVRFDFIGQTVATTCGCPKAED